MGRTKTKVEQIGPLSIAAVFVLGIMFAGTGSIDGSVYQESEELETEEYQNEEDPIDTEEMMDETEEDLMTEDLLPIWTAPRQYRVEIQLSWGGQSLTVRRFVSANRIRSEVLGEDRQSVWLESGDARGSLYQVMDSESLAIVHTLSDPACAFGSRQLGSRTDGYPIEYLGEDTIAGKRALEYRIANSEGVVMAWFDIQSGAPLRMETERDGVPFVITWRSLNVKAQPDDLFAVPEGFTVREHEPSAAPEDNRAGMAIVGRLSDEDAATIDGGSPDPDWGLVFHAPDEDTAQAYSHAFGGLLGSIAGAYLPGWLGAVLAGTLGGQT